MTKQVAALALGALLLAGCSAGTIPRALPGVGMAPVPPRPVGDAPAAREDGWRPYAAPARPVAETVAPPVRVGAVDSAPLAPVPGLPPADGAPAAPAPPASAPPGWQVGPAPTAERPGATDGALSVPKAGTWGGRPVAAPSRPYAASPVGPAASSAPTLPAGPRPYTPPHSRVSGGFHVRSAWADGAVPAAERGAFEGAVRAAASGGDGAWTAADGEAFAASRVVGAPGRCVAIEIVGTRPGTAGITRRGSAEACPR